MKTTRNIVNNFIKIIAVLIPLATAFIVIFNQIQVSRAITEYKDDIVEAINNLTESQVNCENGSDEINLVVEEIFNNKINTSMEQLIGIFGIIISVWVGLNIYNILKKDDYNELSETIVEKCIEHDVMHRKIEEIYSGNMELHISYLYKTFDVNNNSSNYFFSMFKSIDTKQLDYKFLLNATFLETIYVKLTTFHEKNEHFKMKPYIEEGMHRCDDMLEWVRRNEDKIANKNKLLGYITYRYGRMLFYQGMMQYYANSNNDAASMDFMESAQKFIDALSYDDGIAHNIDIYNTLGYIYIKVYEWNINRLAPLYNNEKMKMIIENALYYCQISMHKTVNSLKNWGIALERKGDLDIATQKYQDAVNKAPGDYMSRFCLASAYLKKAQRILGIREKRDTLLCDMQFEDPKMINNAKEYIDQAEFQLNIAHKINSEAANYYYKLGQLYTYRYLLETDATTKNEYSLCAYENLRISYSLNPIYGSHKFHERNYYEAIENIDYAIKINQGLDGLDVEHLMILYKRKLNSKQKI